MQKDCIQRKCHGAQLVGDVLGRMEMPHVQAKQQPLPDGVAKIEFVTADRARLDSDAEQLALDGIKHVRPIMNVGKHRVERRFQPHPRRTPVDGRVLIAVRNPDVVDHGRADFTAHPCRNLPCPPPVLDPELANALVRMGKRQVVVGLSMGEKGRVEIEPEPVYPGPVDPVREMLVLDFVAIRRVVSIHVHGVKIETVPSRDHRKGELQVSAQFAWVTGTTRMVSGCLDTAARRAAFRLEADYVVSLPAVDGYRDRPESINGVLRVDAPLRKDRSGGLIGHDSVPIA